MKSRVKSQGTCSNLGTQDLEDISCPGTREKEDECDDSVAANDTLPVLSSALDVPAKRFPVASSECRTALSMICGTVVKKQRSRKEVCIGNLNRLSADTFE